MASACYRIGGNFCQEKIFANFATCSHRQNFLSANFLPRADDYIEDMATFYRIGENLFHRIFLQYKGIWAWRNFCLAKIFTYTVFIAFMHAIVRDLYCAIGFMSVIEASRSFCHFCLLSRSRVKIISVIEASKSVVFFSDCPQCNDLYR